jgi:hypothetical protein
MFQGSNSAMRLRMIGDAAEHVAQVGFGIEAVELGAFNKGVDRGGALAARSEPLMPRLWRGLSSRFAAHSAYHGADDRSLGHI